MKRQGKQRGQNNPVSVLEEDWSCFEKKKRKKETTTTRQNKQKKKQRKKSARKRQTK